MAKKSGINKSKAIREYYEANPDAKPIKVSAALKKKGIDVTPAFVSTIRSTSKKKTSVGKPGRPAGAKLAKTGRHSGDVSLTSLLKVKEIVDEMGGIGEARKALDALEKLTR